MDPAKKASGVYDKVSCTCGDTCVPGLAIREDTHVGYGHERAPFQFAVAYACPCGILRGHENIRTTVRTMIPGATVVSYRNEEFTVHDVSQGGRALLSEELRRLLCKVA